jgi:predicted nucleic acid-binding protein
MDTSAFVPLVIDEPGSETCERVWVGASALASSVLLWAECMAALSMARRTGRLSPGQLRTAVRHSEELIGQVALVSATPRIAERAGALALTHGLRGYDAVHLATAQSFTTGSAPNTPADDLALVSGDRALLDAASRSGLTIVDTSPG